MRGISTIVGLFVFFFVFVEIGYANQPPDIPNEHSNNLDFNIPFGEMSFTFKIFAALDPEGDSITYELVSPPYSGEITGCFDGTNSTTCTYTPYYSGVFESMTYRATDGNGYSRNININIMDFGTYPVTMKGPQTVKVLMNAPSKFIVLGGNNQYLYFETVALPQHGTLSNCFELNPYSRICTYTPNPGFSGVDSFTYRGSDYFSNSANQTVTFEVVPVNNLPELTGSLSLTATGNNYLNIKILKGTDADSDNIFYKVSSSPQHGNLSDCFESLVDTEFSLSCVYKSEVGYIGPDSFTVVANDGKQNSSTSLTVNLNIQSQNNSPSVGTNQSVSLNEDSSVNFTVNSGTDPDNDSLEYFVYSYPSHGTLSNCLNSNTTNSYSRNCTYKPNQNYNGTDSFSYRVKDGQNSSTNTATVTFNVSAVNDAPVMYGDHSSYIQVNQPTFVTLPAATDADNNNINALVFYIVTPPAHGVLQDCLEGTNDLTCVYYPDQGFTGVDTITYKANDGTSDSVNVAYYAFRVGVSNQKPSMVGNQTFNGYENTELLFTLNGATDADNDPLKYHIVSLPAYGTLADCLNETSDLTCRYIPDPSFKGTVSFTYKVNDGIENSTLYSTVTLNILNSNDAPLIGGDQSFSVNENQILTFNISPGTDLDGDYLTYELVDSPSSGLVYGCANGTGSTTCFYQPEENFSGEVSFIYKTYDGNLYSTNIATVSISVLEVVNGPPVMATDQTFTINEDQVLEFTINPATSVSGNELTYSLYDISDDPQAGTISGCLQGDDDLTCTYTPAPNVTGTYTFDYTASDGDLNAETPGRITITILPVNNAPSVLEDQNFKTEKNTAIDMTLNGAIDLDSEALTYEIVQTPTKGVLSNCLNQSADLECTYTPNQNEMGTDTFTYRANDGSLNSSTVATVSMDIVFTNTPPRLANSQTIETNEDISVDFILGEGTDENNDVLTYNITSAPAHGTLSNCLVGGTSLNCTYTPNANYSGADSFSYVASDGTDSSLEVGQVSILVNAVNDVPVMIADQNFSTNEDLAVNIVLNGATDIDGNTLKYTVVTAPTHGALTNCLNSTSDLSCIYTPNNGFSGTEIVTYIASDGSVDTSSFSTVTITVTGQNDAPIIGSNQTLETNEDVAINFELSNSVDPDGDIVFYNLSGSVTNGVLTGCLNGTSNRNCTFTPSANFNGQVQISYSVSDGLLNSLGTALVTINVLPLNDAPMMIGNQTLNPEPGFTLLGATDVDSALITYQVVEPPKFGQLSNCLNSTSDLICSYTPNQGFYGEDSFSYIASDGQSSSVATSTVTLIIDRDNAPPVMIGNQTFEIEKNESFNLNLNGATDTDNDSIVYSIVNSPSDGVLQGCLNNTNDLSCTYLPPTDFTGVVSFSYIAFDGRVQSASFSTVTINIIPTNNAPVMAGNQSFNGNQNQPLSIVLFGATDLDGNNLSYSIVEQPIGGVISNCLQNNNDLTCTYTPGNGFFGSDSFTYKANDGKVDSVSFATVSINIQRLNSLPVMPAQQQFITYKNNPIVFNLTAATDVDGNELSYSRVLNPASGVLSSCLENNDDLSCEFTPALNFVGEITFSYRAFDGNSFSSSSTLVKIVVQGLPQLRAIEKVATDPGGSNSCALLNDGGIRCWGSSASGQLGYGNTNTIGDNEHAKVAGDVNTGIVTKLVAPGTGSTCAQSTTDQVKCWGFGNVGTLGYGNTTTIGDNEFPSSVGFVQILSAAQISAGQKVLKVVNTSGNFSCALISTGNVRCWGFGANGLGYSNTNNIGDNEFPYSAGNVNVGKTVQDLFAGTNHICALTTDNNLRCWGTSANGQLGYSNTNTVGDNETPASRGDVQVLSAQERTNGLSIAQVALGGSHSCILTNTGSVRCWGRGALGALGYGNTNDIGDNELPRTAGFVNVGGTVTKIVAGGAHTCAILNTGKLRCWGFGLSGRLGYGHQDNIGDDESPTVAGDINLTENVIDVSLGSGHTLALVESKRVKPWGASLGGSLGNASNNIALLSPWSSFISVLDDQANLISIFDTIPLSPTEGQPLTLSGSRTINTSGTITSYSWDFGDGQTGSGQSVSHTFSSIGMYNVKLTVTNSFGQTSDTTKIITVLPLNQNPIADFELNPNSVSENEIIELDAALSEDFDGNIVEYRWDFGDGHFSDGLETSHIYDEPGFYDVELTVVDDRGGIGSKTVEIYVNDTPTANFVTDVQAGPAPLDIAFDASSSVDNDGSIADYFWDFGDGNFGANQNVSHTYLFPGTYTAKLVVTDDFGTQNEKILLITVDEMQLPPVADFIISSNQINAGGFIAVDATSSSDSDGGVKTITWNFGDGETASGVKASHVYTSGGSYTVTVTVEDVQGLISTQTMTVDVNHLPIADFNFNPATGDFPLVVNFNGSTSSDIEGAINSYQWNFGDGQTSTGVMPSHTFTSDGIFNVTLTVTDSNNATSIITKQLTVTKANENPVADFNVTLTENINSVTAQLNANSSSDPDGNIATYAWEFPDNTTATGVNVSKTFNQAYATPVRLTVTDNRGGQHVKELVLEYFIPRPNLVVEKTKFNLIVGASNILRPTIYDRKGDLVANQSFSVSNTNPTSVTALMNSQGVNLLGLAAGSATITVTHTSSGETKAFDVTVVNTSTLATNIPSDFFTSQSILKFEGKTAAFGQFITTNNSSSRWSSSNSNGYFNAKVPLIPGINTYQVKNNSTTINQSINFFDGIGRSLTFDGNDQVSFKLGENFLNNSFTISMWVRNNGKASTLLNLPTANEPHIIQINDRGHVQAGLVTEHGYFGLASAVKEKTDWVKITLIYDDTNKSLELYSNKDLVSSTTISGTILPFDFAQDIVLGEGYKGHLDELRIWKRALSQAEVTGSLFSDTATAPTDLWYALDFEKISSSVTLGYDRGEDDADPSFKVAAKMLVNKTINPNALEQITSQNVSLQIEPKVFANAVAITLTKEDAGTLERLPSELEVVSNVYRIMGDNSASIATGAKIRIPLEANLLAQDVIVLTSNASGETNIVNPNTLKFEQGLVSIPVSRFGDYFIVKKSEIIPVVEFAEPLFSESEYEGIATRRLVARGNFGSQLEVDGDSQGLDISGIYCNGTWLTSFSADFPVTLPLVSGENKCQIDFKYQFPSNSDFYLRLPHVLNIKNN
ncbi:MAG: tandem-95 repeat protein [Bacteriovoracaceae bacterium]|nr:tandem-95 repeat protein [Bacteriovoracaceae bacterium]